ncbi:hypothetical protein BDM02DRAFT_1433658 [Thelephora ganbajun]|uniref:Uncharacterized protein n=1 Tax=Thelephora ganbajun TaxID=370292 RepID=A0ACB6ZLJ9_THEGA|nr:hypothetical protein BDM02DRAFT_1433658 [Thelephora ganbajun]
MAIFLLLLLSLFVLFSPVLTDLTDAQVAVVKQRLAEGSQRRYSPCFYLGNVFNLVLCYSWELGTRAQALLELDSPRYSVTTPGAKLPPSNTNPPSSLTDVFTIARNVVSGRSPAGNTPQPFIEDGSAGDPPSVGVAVMLANWTNQQSSDGQNYAQAIRNQFNYLYTVPRTSDGAISHRPDQLQLWSDFIYMVPPFLAYYGIMTKNRSTVAESYNQIRLYRKYLRDQGTDNLWKHMAFGDSQDTYHWSTGNGWAAAGMLRVLGTIKNSDYAGDLKNEQNDLIDWVLEIQDGMYKYLRSTSCFGNYADDDHSFDDAASATLLAATVYRLSTLAGNHKHIPLAERTRIALTARSNLGGGPSNGTFVSMVHFDADGWLSPVVNPWLFGESGSKSPEAQAFVLMMQAGYQDWAQAGYSGANAGVRSAVPLSLLASFAVGVALMLALFQ